MSSICPICDRELPEEPGVKVTRQDILKVMKGWKMIKNIPTEGPESRQWDILNYKMFVSPVKKLIKAFGGWEGAVRCMEYVWEDQKRLNFEGTTLYTVLKRADIYREHLAKNGH